MLYENDILCQSKTMNVYEIESIHNFNKQVADNYNKKVVALEKEVVGLRDLLVLVEMA